VPLPAFTDQGDLPAGVHRATLRECLDRLGTTTPQRKAVASRLERIYHVAEATGVVARFVIFGSFVTTKPQPNDIDVFMLMEDRFDVGKLSGEAKVLFDHGAAQAHLEPVYSSCDESPPWTANKPPLSIGRSSAMER
jgi:hypothetical protein